MFDEQTIRQECGRLGRVADGMPGSSTSVTCPGCGHWYLYEYCASVNHNESQAKLASDVFDNLFGEGGRL